MEYKLLEELIMKRMEDHVNQIAELILEGKDDEAALLDQEMRDMLQCLSETSEQEFMYMNDLNLKGES